MLVFFSFLFSFFFFLFFSSCARYQRLSKERIYLVCQWLADDTTLSLSLSFSEMRLSRTSSSQASWHGYSQEYQDAINRTKSHQSLGISRTQKRIALSQCLSVSRFCSSNEVFPPGWSPFFFCPSLILDRRISTHSLPPAAAAFIWLPCHETFSQY